jgi:phage gpG-like protein
LGVTDLLQVRLDVDGAIKGLQRIGERLLGKTRDFTPVTKDMGERMRFSIEENFRTGGRPERWKQWALSTALAEARSLSAKGITSKEREQRLTKAKTGMVLIRSGRLKNSITYKPDSTGLTVGTNVIYARIQQLGGETGRGGKVRIPARPYLVVQESDLAYFRKRILEHVSQ